LGAFFISKVLIDFGRIFKFVSSQDILNVARAWLGPRPETLKTPVDFSTDEELKFWLSSKLKKLSTTQDNFEMLLSGQISTRPYFPLQVWILMNDYLFEVLNMWSYNAENLIA
jgi:hypothetical protein